MVTTNPLTPRSSTVGTKKAVEASLRGRAEGRASSAEQVRGHVRTGAAG